MGRQEQTASAALVSALGKSHQTPASSHPRSLHRRGPLSVLCRKGLGPLLWGQDFVYLLQWYYQLQKNGNKSSHLSSFHLLSIPFLPPATPTPEVIFEDQFCFQHYLSLHHLSSLEEDLRVWSKQ